MCPFSSLVFAARDKGIACRGTGVLTSMGYFLLFGPALFCRARVRRKDVKEEEEEEEGNEEGEEKRMRKRAVIVGDKC